MTTILEHKEVKIRKPQKCWGCSRGFPIGTTLQFHKQVDNGEFVSSYWCNTCRKYWDEFMDNDDEIGFGDLRFNDSEHYEQFRKTVEGN